jgi:hypothetical protein
VRQRGHVLESRAECSRGDLTGKSVNPAGRGRHSGIENIFVETKNAAAQVSLFIRNREQESVGINVIADRVGSEITGVDVVYGLIEIKKVK